MAQARLIEGRRSQVTADQRKRVENMLGVAHLREADSGKDADPKVAKFTPPTTEIEYLGEPS